VNRDPVEAVVRLAALHHLSALESNRMAARFPRFRRSHAGQARLVEETLRIEFRLDEPAWGALEDSALRQRTTLELLIEHAVWCYLANPAVTAQPRP